mgnify:CR=1 FL=1
MAQKIRIARRTALQGLGLGVLATSVGFGSKLCAQGSPAVPSGPWATGGTAAMGDAINAIDPFAMADRACSLTCEQILGPCYAPSAPVRQDISEGEPGIPVRMAFRLVTSGDCEPIANAEIEIWHTSQSGHYSAEDVQAGRFCTSGDAHAEASYFFRGRGISDADGRVTFDSCYPGWYGGRALHVHLLLRMPDHAGETTTSNLQTVTQLYFPEEMTREICSSVAGYRERGQPDISNSTDNVLRMAGDADGFMFGIERSDDGAMLAYKTIEVGIGESCGSRGFNRGFGRRMS